MYFENASCGIEILGTINGKTYQGVEAVRKAVCGFYLPDYPAMGV